MTVVGDVVLDPDPFAVFGPVPAVSDPAAAASLAVALAAPVGPERIAGLAQVDARLLDAHDLVDHMTAWAQCVSWVTGQGEVALARVAGPAPEPELGTHDPSSKPTGDIAEDARCASVGAALHITPCAAMTRIGEARNAVTVLAPVTARVLEGVWTRSHLWSAGQVTAGHRVALAAAAVAAACAQPGADQWTPGRLGTRIKRELVRLDSDAVAKRIRARRHDRGARLDPEGDLRGRISVEGSWETMSWAFRQFRRWAETERDRLRHIRKHDPSARFCCPQAMARLLTHATGDTHSTGTGGAGSNRGSAGPGAGEPIPGVDNTGSHPNAGYGAGTGDGPVGLAGPDGLPLRPQDPCPFCGAADTGVPSLSALTADAVIAAAGLLATALNTPTTPGSPGSPVGEPAGASAGHLPGDVAGDLVPARGKRWRYAAVVVDLPTLAGLADNPGHVPGYGPVPAAIARELAANAPAWRRFLTDTTGVLLDAGADTYRPSERLREHVAARDWTCTFPGCGRSACDADLDHIDNYDGANTLASNLQPLCRTHHRVKTHTDWTPQRRPDGTTTWTAPTGHTYHSTPETPWSHGSGTRNADAAGRGPAGHEAAGPGPDGHGPAANDPDGKGAAANEPAGRGAADQGLAGQGPAWDVDPRLDQYRHVKPKIEAHWTPPPTTRAERALAALLADPRITPARAP